MDGLPVPGLPYPSRSLVQGDAQSLLIAAASIIAKVTRDREMEELDGQFPGYGFAAHKGYGTAPTWLPCASWDRVPSTAAVSRR